jgi:hypothetical protein
MIHPGNARMNQSCLLKTPIADFADNQKPYSKHLLGIIPSAVVAI